MDFDQLKDAEASGFNPHAVSAFTPFTADQSAFPIEPAHGTVLGFTKRYSADGPAYSFAAIRVTPRSKSWYLTGQQTDPVDWLELLSFIGGPDEWRTVGVVASWTPLVP